MLQPLAARPRIVSSTPNSASAPETQNVMTVDYLPQSEKEDHNDHPHLEPHISSFAGRVGGNQDFILDRNDPGNVELLERVPDAAPCMTFAEIFDLKGFYSLDLWKFAMLECVGMHNSHPACFPWTQLSLCVGAFTSG